MAKSRFLAASLLLLCSLVPRSYGQQSLHPDSDLNRYRADTYPRAVGYLSFIIPVLTANKTALTFDTQSGTTIGFPFGVNVLYSRRFGFSYEMTPSIKWSAGSSKVNNVLFDPGTMFRFDHGFTIISRLAFETGGRYGFTPVFNQVYARTKYVNYFIALSTPVRFGNNQPPSIGLSTQFGFTFN